MWVNSPTRQARRRLMGSELPIDDSVVMAHSDVMSGMSEQTLVAAV